MKIEIEVFTLEEKIPPQNIFVLGVWDVGQDGFVKLDFVWDTVKIPDHESGLWYNADGTEVDAPDFWCELPNLEKQQ